MSSNPITFRFWKFLVLFARCFNICGIDQGSGDHQTSTLFFQLQQPTKRTPTNLSTPVQLNSRIPSLMLLLHDLDQFNDTDSQPYDCYALGTPYIAYSCGNKHCEESFTMVPECILIGRLQVHMLYVRSLLIAL